MDNILVPILIVVNLAIIAPAFIALIVYVVWIILHKASKRKETKEMEK